MSETIEVTKDRVIAEVIVTADSSGVIKGGHVRWHDRLLDSEGEVIHSTLGPAEPIEGALQAGDPFSSLVSQIEAQLIQTALWQEGIIQDLQQQIIDLESQIANLQPPPEEGD